MDNEELRRRALAHVDRAARDVAAAIQHIITDPDTRDEPWALRLRDSLVLLEMEEFADLDDLPETGEQP